MAKRGSVLIVDDDSEICETLADVLEMEGFYVDTAKEGEEGIKKAKEKFFEVVLMDIKMPGMNGAEAFKEIKKISPRTGAIIMTAYAVEALIKKAINDCAFGVIYKPFEMERMLDRIEKVRKAAHVGKCE